MRIAVFFFLFLFFFALWKEKERGLLINIGPFRRRRLSATCDMRWLSILRGAASASFSFKKKGKKSSPHLSPHTSLLTPLSSSFVTSTSRRQQSRRSMLTIGLEPNHPCQQVLYTGLIVSGEWRSRLVAGTYMPAPTAMFCSWTLPGRSTAPCTVPAGWHSLEYWAATPDGRSEPDQC